MISLYKLKTRGAGPIFFSKNSEILGQHALGIDTAFTTTSDSPTHNLGVLAQANAALWFSTLFWTDLDNLSDF